jgi:hypothetical protein
MKKLFPLTHPRIQPERLVDSIRAEINKYVKRERRKKLPEGVDFRDFDCRVGASPETAEAVHLSAVSKAIGQAQEAGQAAVYVELIPKPRKRIRFDKLRASVGKS